MIKDKHREAKRFELDIAEDLGARRIFLSGAGMEKADVRKRVAYRSEKGRPVRSDALAFRVEAKTTVRGHYTFRTIDWWDLRRVADPAGEVPVFAIRFIEQAWHDTVIIRLSQAQELGCARESDPVQQLNRSVVVYPGDRMVLQLPTKLGLTTARPDKLTIVPYSTFLEKVREHADSAQRVGDPYPPQHRG